jgi:integrase/recombinase XerD
MAGLGKQAKILTDKQVGFALAAVATRRYPLRDRVIILLSVRAGLRTKEISNLRWSMVTDAQAAVTDTIHLVNGASKGKRGGREIPMAKDLRQALVELQAFKPAAPEDRIIFSDATSRRAGASSEVTTSVIGRNLFSADTLFFNHLLKSATSLV